MKTNLYILLTAVLLLFTLHWIALAWNYPNTIIYKTKNNYNQLVPITLSYDKSNIDNYPDISVWFPYPTVLHQWYLWDNRGIGPTSAFLNLNYEEYANLNKTPFSDELLTMIKDKNPFLVIYYCGDSKYSNEELNRFIDQGILYRKCIKLKNRYYTTLYGWLYWWTDFYTLQKFRNIINIIIWIIWIICITYLYTKFFRSKQTVS